jgi:hypothetical protein
MKRIFLVLIATLLFLGMVEAQTGVSAWNTNDANGTYKVDLFLKTQTTDSTTKITSNAFSLPSYSYRDFTSYPITFCVKTTSTYTGTPPKCLITLNGVFGDTYSLVLDTLRNNTTNQSITDTVGILTLTAYPGVRAPAYTISVTNSGNAIATGFIELIFTKERHYEIK